MKNKGFTLIELLAVIVILAVIALIAIPLISHVIATAKKGSKESSAYGYIDAVEKQVALSIADKTKITLEDGVYEINELTGDESIYRITVKGEKPSEGWVQIVDKKVVDYSIKIDEYIIEPNAKNEAKATNKTEIREKPTMPGQPPKPQTYKINYHGTMEGISGTMEPTICIVGEDCVVEDSTFTYTVDPKPVYNSEYRFYGWATTDSDDVVYEKGAIINKDDKSDIDLYAVYALGDISVQCLGSSQAYNHTYILPTNGISLLWVGAYSISGGSAHSYIKVWGIEADGTETIIADLARTAHSSPDERQIPIDAETRAKYPKFKVYYDVRGAGTGGYTSSGCNSGTSWGYVHLY